MNRDDLGGEDVLSLECYADLQPWAITLCEAAYQDSLVKGRRRRAARMDFVPGWKEAARQLGRPDVFKEPGDVPDTKRLTENDLTPYMQREFERAYEVRDRKQASREDFLAGFIAALVSLNSKSSFKAGSLDS